LKGDEMRLQGKVAIITGAARGIGRETALLFAAEGAKVVICDLLAEGEEVAEEIRSRGGEAIFYKLDVTDRESVKRMVNTVTERYGRIDILVNNAGITRDAQFLKMTEGDWDKVIAVNLKGVFNVTQAVAPVMVAQGKGKIVNAASVVALYGNFGQTNYVASKAGVIGMTKVWARELGRKGINVNAVAPGFIQTEMTAKVPERVLQMMRERTPLGRLGTPRDVAYAYLFLASDESDYVNGAVLSVDGGLVI
jgi:3-oxoacyl-[acyl-carrier protein] reductase